jgi:hypothetical protein
MRMSWLIGGWVAAWALVIAGPGMAGDGVLEINQTCAVQTGCFPGDAPGLAVTINEPGSYRLTSNLEITRPTVTAIEVGANDVTIDMNGFAIRGPVSCVGTPPQCTASGAGKGVFVNGGNRFAIHNGIISGMGSHGVEILGWESIVERLRLIGNAGDCIKAGQGALVRINTMRLCGGNGIRAFSGSRIEGNHVAFVGSFGINLADQLSGFIGNVLRENNGGGPAPQTFGGLELGPNNCQGSTSCP